MTSLVSCQTPNKRIDEPIGIEELAGLSGNAKLAVILFLSQRVKDGKDD